MGYILAIDVGTTAVKAILVDIATNEMRGASADCTLIQERAAWAEQDADGLWQAVCTAVRRCLSQTAVRPGEVAGLVISAPWKHVIPLDGDCRPLRRGIIWMDGRAAVQAKRLEQLLGAPLENAQGYWSRLLWLKENEPHIWRRARYIAGINAYFRYRATGRLCTECSDDFIHSPDPELQALYDRVLEKTGLAEDRDKFPPCIRCTDLVGPLTRTGAQELGLAPGTPMFGGFGDLPAVYFGAGCAQPGTAHIYIGTSSWFGEFLPRRIGGYSAGWFTASGQAQGALFALTTGGRAYEWAIHRFYRAERQRLGEDIYPFLEGEMESVEPGCGGLNRHPLAQRRAGAPVHQRPGTVFQRDRAARPAAFSPGHAGEHLLLPPPLSGALYGPPRPRAPAAAGGGGRRVQRRLDADAGRRAAAPRPCPPKPPVCGHRGDLPLRPDRAGSEGGLLRPGAGERRTGLCPEPGQQGGL